MTIEQRQASRARLLASARRDPHAFVREARRSARADSPVAIEWTATYDKDANAVQLVYNVSVTAPDTYFQVVVPIIEDTSAKNPYAGAFQCMDPGVENTSVEGQMAANEWAPSYAGLSVLVGVFGYVEQNGQSQAFEFSQTIQT